MIKIGVTGGIGSGKTVVSTLFRLHDIPVFNADKVARELNDSSPFIRAQLIFHFGEELYSGTRLNRKQLASLIFQDKEKLAIVNNIIHPVVSSSFNEWCSERNDHSLVVIDAAVLIEAGFHRIVDKVITVTAPQAMRIERVMKRDQSARHEVEVRMRHQLSDEEKIKQSDFVIYNDNRQSLIAQVDALLLSGAFNSQYQ